MTPKEYFEKCSELKIPVEVAVNIFLKKFGSENYKESLVKESGWLKDFYDYKYNPITALPKGIGWAYDKVKDPILDTIKVPFNWIGEQIFSGAANKAMSPSGLASIAGLSAMPSLVHHSLGSLFKQPGQSQMDQSQMGQNQMGQNQMGYGPRYSVANAFKGYRNYQE